MLLFMLSWLKVPFNWALGGVNKQQHYFSQQELIIEINYCFFQTTAVSPEWVDVKKILVLFAVFVVAEWNKSKRAGFSHMLFGLVYLHRFS